MQFRLIYQGPLHAQSSSSARIQEKHKIRKVLHKQLARLWEAHPFLTKYLTDLKQGVKYVPDEDDDLVFMEDPDLAIIGKEYAIAGYNFIPLIGKSFGASACALDILFLRRDHPGDLVKSGGDIDNRLKVLFDALRMPLNAGEICGPSDADERPFFCLLEDDRLITEVRVSTDRLLMPPCEVTSGHEENDVHLIIHVKTLVSGSDGQVAFLI